MNRLGVAFPRNGSITIRMSMMKKETLNFRVSADFKRKLAEEAKKERRSLTNYLETALTKFWEQQESRVERKGEGGRT
jgi:predicted transcriptional regulator